nr:hypothetical protein [uncultured Enterobacter sp.]
MKFVLLTVVLLAVIVLGGVSLKAQSLRVNKFEAQGIELNFQGVVPRTKQ